MAIETQMAYQGLPEFIKKSIDKEVKLAMDEEIEKAKKRIDERKSEIITGVLLHVQKQINFDSMKDTLIISVKI